MPLRLRRCAAVGVFVPVLLWAAGPNPVGKVWPRPLVFEPNQGQADPDVKVLSRTSHYTLRLHPREVEFSSSGSGTWVRMRWEGAAPRAQLEGLEPLPGKSFYYVGNDPSRWHARVPNYGRVRYRGLYPGIDVVFRGSAGELEYDLIVEPQADVNRLRLGFEGAREISLKPSGDLRIESRTGVLRQKKPVIFQEQGGQRRAIGGHYVVEGRQVRFAVEGYDQQRRLVIDPAVIYATYFGGGGDDVGVDLAVDKAGNAYFTGYTRSVDFPAVPKTAENATRGARDAFVTKLDPTGQRILYSVILGGTSDDGATSIAVDPVGNAYITGGTFSVNFPTLNAYQAYSKGGADAFVAKLDPSGNLVYSTYLGGGQMQPCRCGPNAHGPGPHDLGVAILADASGNAYLTGQTWSADFPFNLGVRNRTPDGGDAFVAKFGPAGNLVFSTLIGGSAWEGGRAITLGSSGTIWVAGESYSPDLPVTAGVIQPRYGGHGGHSDYRLGDAWVAKLDPAAASQDIVVALTYLGGSLDDYVTAIRADSSDNLYLTGGTISQDFPVTAGALQTKFGGGAVHGDAWVAKLNPTLTTRLFVTYFGGSGDDVGMHLALDPAGNPYVTGLTVSADLMPASLGSNPSALQAGYSGSGAGFYLLELNPAGNSALYFTYLGSGLGVFPAEFNTAMGGGIGLDGAGSVYVLGLANSAGIPVVQPALQPKLAGGLDCFLIRANLAPPAVPVISSLSPASVTAGRAAFNLTVNGSNFVNTSVVQWNGSARPTTFVSSTQLTAAIAAADVAAAGTAQVTVVTPSPGGGTSNALSFSIAAAPPGNQPVISSVVNGASYRPGIAAASWVTIYGSNLANTSPGRTWRTDEIVNGNLPTSLDGVSVTINGKAAYVYYISPGQINVQAPSDSAQGPVNVVVRNNGASSAAATAQLQPFSPAFFQYTGTRYAIATRYPDNALIANPSSVPGAVGAKPGDVLILWGTGFGATDPETPAGVVVSGAAVTRTAPSITVGGAGVTVLGAALSPGSAGLYQVAIQLPSSLPTGDVAVQATVGNFQSPASVNIFVSGN